MYLFKSIDHGGRGDREVSFNTDDHAQSITHGTAHTQKVSVTLQECYHLWMVQGKMHRIVWATSPPKYDLVSAGAAEDDNGRSNM